MNEIVLDIDPPFAVVTLNRPERRNAMSLAMWQRLGEVFTGLKERIDVRVIILTGADGHFCAGADISEFEDVRSNANVAETYERAVQQCHDAIRTARQPTIAAITGFCMGGGCALAMACDFRVAQKESRFGIPAAKLGIVYSIGDTANLVSLVGPSNAKRILFSGARFEAPAMAEMGFVDELVDQDPVAESKLFADSMVGNAPFSILGAKTTINAMAEGALERHEKAIAEIKVMAMNSRDYEEGRRAFMEKRPPAFEGR